MNTTLTSKVYHYDTWIATEFKLSLNVVCVHMQEQHSETKGQIKPGVVALACNTT